MTRLIGLAESAAKKAVEALIGSEPCPIGGVLDIGWEPGDHTGEGEQP